MKERSDQKWIRLLKQQDKEAIDDLWRLLFTMAGQTARRFCGHDQMRAQDVGSEAAMKAFMRITKYGIYQFKFTGPFEGYCRRIVINEVYRVFRREPEPSNELPDGLVSKAVSGSRQEILPLLQPCLDQLTSRERDVMELLYLKEMETDEAAEQLGIRRNNLYRIGHRLRKKLKACLEGRGFASSDDLV